MARLVSLVRLWVVLVADLFLVEPMHCGIRNL